MSASDQISNWGVFDSSFNEVFDIDTCVEVGFKGSSKVSQFPIEQGGFASYNKVQQPEIITIRMAVGGDETRMADFVDKMKTVKKSMELYTVMTPENTYKKMTMVSYSYKRTQERGQNMIVADMQFDEIRLVTAAYKNVKISIPKPKVPSAADAAAGGKKSVVDPNSIYAQIKRAPSGLDAAALGVLHAQKP